MAKDPWTGPDPQTGDFDDELAAIDLRDLQVVEAGSKGKVTIVVSVEARTPSASSGSRQSAGRTSTRSSQTSSATPEHSRPAPQRAAADIAVSTCLRRAYIFA
jgi:hypothetical protein